jgi:hypothetical protein
MTES